MPKLKYIAVNYNDDQIYYRESISDHPAQTKKITDRLIKKWIQRDLKNYPKSSKAHQKILLKHNVYNYRIIAVTDADIQKHFQ